MAELKDARFICKSFDQAAVPFLFDEVIIAASDLDLDNAELVASRFGFYIKTITLSSVECQNLTRREFFARGRRSKQRWYQRNTTFEYHLEHAFIAYKKAQRGILEINRGGELLARLSLILSKLPNIRKMILTNCGDIHPHRLRQREDDLCPFKVCNLFASDHDSFHVHPTLAKTITPIPLHLAVLAISTAKVSIRELAIYDGYSYNHSVLSIDSSFKGTARQSRGLSLQLQSLTKLRLRFGVKNPDKERPNPADLTLNGGLSLAVNLQSLFIEGDYLAAPTDLTMFRIVLQDCEFPKLRSLILKMVDFEEDEILGFLETSPCLEHMMLEWFTLTVGSWENMVEGIRSALRLKSVLLDNIRGGSPTFEDSKVYSKDHHLIENFFLRNGGNPFTEKAMDLWTGEDRATKWRACEDVDFEDRYQMFH